MNAYLSAEQIAESLPALEGIHPFFGMAFLAFKDANIPVGKTVDLNFSVITEQVLEHHYRPSSIYAGYYNPFLTSRRANRWMRPRYGSTSLQRITKDTFADALIHPSEHKWGWAKDYLEVLRKRHLKSALIPAFDLAVWLFREDEWPKDTDSSAVVRRLVERYRITARELDALFDARTRKTGPMLTSTPLSEDRLLEIVGSPPGTPPAAGAALRQIEIKGVGPVRGSLSYQPADRLNIVTGDNSLGKTFLLDCIWWALTGEWIGERATPRTDTPKRHPAICVRVGTLTGRPQSFRVRFDWDNRKWETPPKRDVLSGLAVYARFDGSFAVWDPARFDTFGEFHRGVRQHLSLSRDEVWEGVRVGVEGRESRVVCNGLLGDWVLWQVGGSRYQEQWKALERCLRTLSPSDEEPLEPGEPARLGDARDVPTLQMPYGIVPITLASAGVRRVAALAYVLVWTWFEHLRNAAEARRPPQQAMVLIVDEVEAHLHPRWQRLIVPAIVRVIQQLAPSIAVQVHLATHSPMVMASAETIFDEESDDLHHLTFVDGAVRLDELPFVKRGTADAWLMSDVFGLAQPRSKEGETAINEAKKLQLSRTPDSAEVRRVNQALTKSLASDDEFWPRWRFFAKQHGVQP
jgi:hypothetical protein